MKRLITLVLLFVTFASSAQKQSYRIGLLFDHLNLESFAYEYQKMESEIKAVVGEDARIIFEKSDLLGNEYDLEKARQNYQALLERCDIIIAFGRYNALVLKQQESYPKPIIVMDDLRDLKNTKITSSSTSGVNNLLYLSYPDNLLTRLNIFKQLSDFTKVGIVVAAPVATFFDFETHYEKLLKDAGIAYKIIVYNTLDDILNQLDGIDALALENSFSLRHNDIKELSQVLIERRIPSFSAISRLDVINGIMSTNVSDDDLTRFFRRIALSIESYVNGTNFSDLPVLIDFNSTILVNRSTASALGVSVRYSMLGDVEFVDDSEINPIAQKVYDLPDLIAEVLERNLLLRSENQEVLISKQNVKSAKSEGFLPEVRASANGIYIDPRLAEISHGNRAELSTGGEVTLKQVLLSADANLNIKIRKSLAKAQQEVFNTKQLDAIFEAVNAYFNVLILKTNAKIQENNLELTRHNLQIAEENYRAGYSGKTDLLRFRSQKAQNTQHLIEATNQLKKSYSFINQLINNDLDYEIDVKEASLEDDVFRTYHYDGFLELMKTPSIRQQLVDFLVQEAIRNAPEIKQLGYSMEVIEHKTKRYGGGRFLPQAALQARYNYQFSRSGKGSVYSPGSPVPPDGTYDVGMNLSFPVFDRNRNRINRQTALLQREQLEMNRDNLRRTISLNIRNSVLDLLNETTNLELSQVSEESAKEALELTQNAYATGAVNIVQLIDAQNNYIASQQAKANATYNYLIQMLQLERYLGNYFLLNTPEDITAFNKRFLEFMNSERR